ncbi:uncharacterized protein BCR38DRAFT_349772 [Pseudomassariella vexata]|uniref:Zn(2)-C6 fungal-type domain-containing protein n=1 Tax=Pseudomassariella vexata TaxID=1141098 RepID=A0A1Y2DN69_9PEZI|nr:uncharacterized protein BCR38DRAFT_349772 [Pseudomassariella vexata]ORY60690.1 hypothetical protein BCR38DRAFT_349772 [Pseudomassariella vexata]
MPCSFCFQRKLSCRMIEKSTRCQKCVRRGRSCDGVLVASSLERMLSQQKKLDDEEEEASENLLALHSRLAEIQSELALAAGRLSRIRKIRKRVKNKSSELFERGIAELDKEDDILPALDSHERYMRSMGVPEDVDWSSFGLGADFSDLGSLIPLDAAGGTAQASGDNAPNAS